MRYLIDIFSVVLLGIIIFQDVKQRQISWILVPLLFFFLLIEAWMTNTCGSLIGFFCKNSIFLILQILLLFIYFSIRKGRLVNIIDSMIGMGDLLLLLGLCIAFSPLNFIFFYTISLVLSLIGFILFRFLRPHSDPTLPLAATLSICFAAVLCCKVIFQVDLYSDELISSLIYPPA